ncbi:hypothetical protein NpPPO83_00005123 [Neofusicoccum parvum]|uniref:Uncharacterized protein n=1 Tax=Neofusicoccum parvum TaxID=310453 RepID=A0ACB5SE46_9PEZI|nr:hypothetical protein NpPPO83_00005123 [Neofusicoccum parvum]
MSGCVTISSFFDNYAALSVISGKPKTETKRDIDDTFDREDFVKRAYNGEYEPIGSDHPDWEKYTVNNTSIWHGNEEDYYGRTIRWHEEWMGIYAGIDIADWNDTIHVRNPTKLIFNATFPIDFTNNHLITSRNDSNSGTDLEDRYLEGICNAFRNCADQVTMLPAGTTKNTLITYAVNAYVAANNGGTRVWNYVRENPRAIALHAYTQGAAVVTGVISAALYDTWKGSGTESQHQDLEKCSTAGTEAGTLAAMVTHTTTTTETITSIQTILQTMTATQYTAAFQITPGTCMMCYAGECAAPDTKKMKARRVGSGTVGVAARLSGMRKLSC